MGVAWDGLAEDLHDQLLKAPRSSAGGGASELAEAHPLVVLDAELEA